MPRWLVLVCCLGLPVPAGAATPRLLVHSMPWYATRDAHDYPVIHGNVRRLIPWLRRAGLSFAIWNEDRSLAALPPVDGGRAVTRAAWKDSLDALYADDCAAAADILAGVQRDLAADEVGDGPDRPTGGAPAAP